MQEDHGEEDLAKLADLIDRVVHDLQAAGLPTGIVSGGSTPTLFHSHKVPGVNEIRPGTYIFNDKNTVASGACDWADCAASIMVTVVSTARPGQIIIDGGSKTFSSDRLATTGEPTFGLVREAPDSVFTKMNEEHGYVDIRKVDNPGFQVGDRLRVIPNHICVCMNLHEQVYGIRGDTVEQCWRVEARGKLQ
jgi:D-serine deaminase-like pyridoxal phosphate-dependent protein